MAEERKTGMNKILLLEDDLSLIHGLSFAFKKQGFRLDVARTLREADTIWADDKYDLLILDVSLPDGSDLILQKSPAGFQSANYLFNCFRRGNEHYYGAGYRRR